jgi:DNA repair exonuclease SbcCD nuclease subunit
MTSELNIAVFGDVHLGHPNTPTAHILANLNRAFPSSAQMKRLDVLIIEGDLFDRSLHLHDPNVAAIKSWMYRILRMCKRHDVELWILEGTPSHDWRQSSWFFFHNEEAQIGAKVKYIDTLCIEYSERLGHILFVPDEWAPETDDTWRQVQQLLQSKGLEQVDYAVMHGSFTFQLPEFVKSPKHHPERYLSIVRKYVFVGHVHKAAMFQLPEYPGRAILAAGSFDRLTHGEEEPKGHWHVSVGGESGDRITFVENTGAKIYRTINCQGLSVEDAFQKLEDVAALPPDSAVRVEAEKGNAILSLDVLRKKYPHVSWSSKVAETAQTQAKMLVDLRSTITQIPITRANIRELLMARVRARTSDPQILNRCEQRLTEITQ